MIEGEGRHKRVRAAHRLSAMKVSKVNKPGLYEDGGGLRLVVTDKGIKRWTLRLTIHARRVERGLGVYPVVGLDEARERAAQMRRAAKEGRDVRLEEKQTRLARTTFAEAFEAFFAIREQQLANGKHVQQWRHTSRDSVRAADRPAPGRRRHSGRSSRHIETDLVRQAGDCSPRSCNGLRPCSTARSFGEHASAQIRASASPAEPAPVIGR